MDPLSDVLSLLKPRSYHVGGFDAGGDWSIRFGPYDGIKCYAVGGGRAWLSVDDGPEAACLEPGDCFVLPRGRPFRLASDLALAPADASTIFSPSRNGGIALCNGGGAFSLVGGHFALAGHHAGVLLQVLPPVVHLRQEADKAALRWSLERMSEELRDPKPGGVLVAQYLASMMLVQALRLHLADGLSRGVGWVFALADRQMSAALAALHDNPAHRWTLQALAERAGMSRSTFALKFKATVGVSPMEYLTEWRMLLAGDRLAHAADPIATIALSLGYTSESAFSTAFRRVMNCSPRHYRQGRRPPPRADGLAQASAPIMDESTMRRSAAEKAKADGVPIRASYGKARHPGPTHRPGRGGAA